MSTDERKHAPLTRHRRCTALGRQVSFLEHHDFHYIMRYMLCAIHMLTNSIDSAQSFTNCTATKRYNIICHGTQLDSGCDATVLVSKESRAERNALTYKYCAARYGVRSTKTNYISCGLKTPTSEIGPRNFFLADSGLQWQPKSSGKDYRDGAAVPFE